MSNIIIDGISNTGKTILLQNIQKRVIKDGEYKYYPYLECGVFKSLVDHKGPTIKLNGKEEVTIDRGDTYKDVVVLQRLFK